MSISLRSGVSGGFGTIQVNGVDKFTVNNDGTVEATAPTAGDSSAKLATTSFVAALDVGNYKKSNILGAVGNSGGTPTGAIFETGTNASGRYTKFANGMVICELAVFNLAVGANAHTQADRGLPTTVLNTTTVYVGAAGQPDQSNVHYSFNAAFLINPTAIRLMHYNGPVAQNIVQIQTIVIGRWY